MKLHTCKHCKRVWPRHTRGLCDRCYRHEDIRELYQPIRREDGGYGCGNNHRPLPEPTDALPCTEAKLAVLMERAAKEQQLWHPDDAKRTDLS